MFIRSIDCERIEFELDDHYDFDAFEAGFFCLHMHFFFNIRRFYFNG